MTRNTDYLPIWNGKPKLLKPVIAAAAGILLTLFMTFTIQMADMSPEERNASMERRAAELRSLDMKASEFTEGGSQRSFGFYRF